MDFYTLVFGSILALIFLYTTLAKLSTKKLPPGPSAWPIIGNIHLLGAKPHISLASLAKKYGPIMSLKLGQITTIVISSSSIAKQVLKNQDQAFSSRFIPNAIQGHNYCEFSVGWLPVCPQWRTLRRILNINIFSPNRLDANQHLRSQKVNELIAYCEKCCQQGEVLDDLFLAATDTTTSTLEWAMAEILKQPEIMKKVQVELAKIIGKGKSIEEADVTRLPYLQCIIKETLRMHPPAPFLVPRKVEQDVELFDYIIPKGSQVLVNVWSIGKDFTFWDEPLVFKPERFWGSDLDMRGQDFDLIPFGAGRRICPGFPLALRIVPVILGSLLNSFDWKLEADNGPEDLDMEEKFGITLAKAHPLRVIPFLL
ncbi:hypothetical protein RDI58_023524 [Solanum bulbocastanum]|uniref:Cytochrome P450 n=1 Tax=Solanum bulbocastanum TaxID=147425 RepID=A0AAN8T430_SOLBU